MTDHYSAVELALRNLVKSQLPSYFPPSTADDQVTKSDDMHYDDGFDYFFTTYPGAFPMVNVGAQVVETAWEIVVDIVTRWKNNQQDSFEQFTTYRSVVFNLLNLTLVGRNLNRTNGVRGVSMLSEERPRFIPLQVDDPNSPTSHIGQVCVVTVRHVANKE